MGLLLPASWSPFTQSHIRKTLTGTFSSEINQENKAIQTESGEQFKLLTMLILGETEPRRYVADIFKIFEHATQEALDSFCLSYFEKSYKEMDIDWLKRKLIICIIVMMISVCVLHEEEEEQACIY